MSRLSMTESDDLSDDLSEPRATIIDDSTDPSTTSTTSTTSIAKPSLVEAVTKTFGNFVIFIAVLLPAMVTVGGKKSTKKKLTKRLK